MSDRRCGTCKHWMKADVHGRCKLLGMLGKNYVLEETDGTRCNDWKDATDAYARGWRDALAAAAALADELTHGDDMLRGLGRAIGEMTPPSRD